MAHRNRLQRCSHRPIAAGPTHAESQPVDATASHLSLVESLTNRELDVLKLLARGEKGVLTARGLLLGFFADGGATGSKWTREVFGEIELAPRDR